MRGSYIPGTQGTRSSFGRQFTSSMPDYPSSSLNPLTKRTSGFSTRLSQQQGSLKRRTSVTRTSPGKPTSVFARPSVENFHPGTLDHLPETQAKGVIVAESPDSSKIVGFTQEIEEFPDRSLSMRSGNLSMPENSPIARSPTRHLQKSDEFGLNRTPDITSPSVKQKISSFQKIRGRLGKAATPPLASSKGPLKQHNNGNANMPSKFNAKVEDEDYLPPLRFSPQKVRAKNKPVASKAVASPSSLRRTAIENRKKVIEKPPRSDIYAWRSTVARRKVRVSSRSSQSAPPNSRLPVPVRSTSPAKDVTSAAREQAMDCTPGPVGHPESEGFTPVSRQQSIEAASTISPGIEYGEGRSPNLQPMPHAYGEPEGVSRLRHQFLEALGVNEITLPRLQDYIQRIEFSKVSTGKLRDIKIQEMHQRMKVVQLLRYSSRYHGASENELGCVKGWLDDLMEELWMIECGKMQPSKIWFDQLYKWLWSRGANHDTYRSEYDSSPNDDIYILYDTSPLKILAAQKEHELFNLRDTGVELLKNGFRNKEKKMIEYWAVVRGLAAAPAACGEDILGLYMRKLTRWDKIELPDSAIQKRRMWYFCIEHYVYWKEAVSYYALALKMMNLLIVFHDLWGMHVDGMSNQEKKDFGVLHDNLYRFASIFQRPVERADQELTWQENECLYCFSKAAADRISQEDRGKNLWMWLTQLAGIAGYGKYYAAIMKVMTDGKDPEYVNQLFETHFWAPRTCSLMSGLKRIKDAMKKHAGPGDRMGVGTKKGFCAH